MTARTRLYQHLHSDGADLGNVEWSEKVVKETHHSFVSVAWSESDLAALDLCWTWDQRIILAGVSLDSLFNAIVTSSRLVQMPANYGIVPKLLPSHGS